MECRLCLNGSPFVCIFTIECKFLDTLICLLKISEQDGLPDMICKDCLKELENIEVFLNKCEESDSILRSKIISDIKQEPKDINYDDSLVSNLSEYQRKEKNLRTNIGTSICEFIDVKSCITEVGKNNSDRGRNIRFISEESDEELLINNERGKIGGKSKFKYKRNNYAKPRACPICGERFINRGTYRYHQQKHYPKAYICDYCKLSYKHKESLIKHIQGYHTMEWEMHSCDICHKLFKHKHSLRVHFKNNHSEKKIVGKTKKDFTCVICNKKFNNKESLKEHILQHINSEKNNCIQCNICSKIFTSNEDLTTHLTYHSDAKPFICRYCPKAFKNEDLRTTHEVTHTAGTPFKCPICQKGFVLKWNLKCHLRRTHKVTKVNDATINEKKAQVDLKENVVVKEEIDAKIFDENNDLSTVEHSDDQKPLSCLVNNLKNDSSFNDHDDFLFNDNDNVTDFDYEDNFIKEPDSNVKNNNKTVKKSKEASNTGVKVKRKYVKRPRGEDGKPIKIKKAEEKRDIWTKRKYIKRERGSEKAEGRLCPVCGLCVERKGFQAHFRTHSVVGRPFECDACGKTYKTKATLKDHIQVHHMKVLIPCRFCSKGFRHIDYVHSHEKLVHGKHEPQKCHICGKEFRADKYLKKHMKIHTGVPRTFQCELCTKAFSERNRMRYHMRVYHSENRPYNCRFCNKGFKTFNHRGRHEMLHTGEVPHKCPVCLKGFNQRSNMKSHFVHNHKELDFNEMVEQFNKHQKAIQQNLAAMV